ncbi:hypothetical protein V8E53_000684 [Lactarius tabidus]
MLDAKLDAPPRFVCVNQEILKRKDPVIINDVRDLVVHIIADSLPPSWIRVQKLVVLLVPGLSPFSTSPTHPPPQAASEPPNLPSNVDPNSEEAAALYAERTQKKSPAQYLLTVGQMVENDYPVPAYIADIFQKSERWMETPQAPADAESPHTVYAIDLHDHGRQGANARLRYRFDTRKVVYDQLVKPPSPITCYLTRLSGITAAALDPVTMTLADVGAHLRTLIAPSTILLGHALESDLNALKLSHAHCIDTALIFHHPRGRPLKPELAWLRRTWLGRRIQDRGPGGHNPEEDARACMDLLKAKIKNGPGYGEFRADFEPILARIARSHSRNRGSNGRRTRTAIVDHGNPGAWHGASATAPAPTVACANDAEVLNGLVGALDSHEFILGRLMGLADALGYAVVAEKTENQNLTGDAAETKTESSEVTPPAPDDSNGNALFTVVTNLNDHLTTLHAALPPRTALLLFSGHSDPRSMSTLAARRAEYQASQQGKKSGSAAAAAEIEGGTVRWSTADDRALEEAVVRARMGLLFVGVKT